MMSCLKNHANMQAIWPIVLKIIIQLYTMLLADLVPISDLVQKDDLVPGCFRVQLSTFLDLRRP